MTKVVKKEEKDFNKVIIEGFAMYASVHVPKKAYTDGEPPQYIMDLVVDPGEEKKLTDVGLKPAKTMVDEDTKKPKEYKEYPGMKVFTLRRKTIKRDGTPVQGGVLVVDSQNNTVPQDVLIGNGSRVRAVIYPYTVEVKGKSMTGHSLKVVQILDLVPYEKRNPLDGLQKTNGFIVQQNKEVNDLLSEDDEPPFEE